METSIFSEKHDMFRKNLKHFLQREVEPYLAGWEAKGYEANRELLPKWAELGCLGITFPEKYGGMNENWIMSLVFHEELCRLSPPSPVLGILSNTEMSSPHINRLGTEEQKQKYLVPIIKGEKFMGVWATEPDYGSDLAHIETTAIKKNGYYVLNGTKQLVTNVSKADYGTMLVRTGPKNSEHRGLSMLIVETSLPGFRAVPLKKMAWRATDTCTLYLDDVHVPVENLLGEEGKGFYQQMIGFERERLSLAAGAVSMSDRAVEESIKYAKERKQFGQPICKFQVIAHKLVDMAVTLESARQFLYKAVLLFCAGVEGHLNPETRQIIYMAKLYCTDVSNQIAYNGVQVFGGYGVMDDFAISQIYRDVRVWNIGGGTSEIQKNVISGLMGL